MDFPTSERSGWRALAGVGLLHNPSGANSALGGLMWQHTGRIGHIARYRAGWPSWISEFAARRPAKPRSVTSARSLACQNPWRRLFLNIAFGDADMSKPYKSQKRGAGRHVQLPEWLQASKAWATLKPGPRALYIELKRRFNGSNNGEIHFSHREAAQALSVHRNTATAWFSELQERGFISLRVAPHLGPSGIGKASVWAIEELPTSDNKPAGKAFMRWQAKLNPRTKNRTGRHKKQDTYPPELVKTRKAS